MSMDLEPRSLIPPWLATSVEVPADHRVLVAAAASGIALDVAVRAGGAGLGGTLMVMVTTAGILASGRLHNRQARWIVCTAPLFGIWLVLRTSPWLLLPDLVVTAGLIGLGVSLGEGSIFDLTIPASAARGMQVLAHGLTGPAYLAAAGRTLLSPASRSRRDRVRAVTRGLLIALPLLAVLGLLLASADAVFAAIFRLDVDPPSILVHVLALALGAWAMGGLLRAASSSPIGRLPAGPHLGWAEVAIVLGLMNTLFLVFAAAQLVALSGGGRKVIQTAGLTYAEYARRGFFQLLAVAVITLATLLVLRSVVRRHDPAIRRRFALFAEVTVALTLAIVYVAIRRLALYADVFGLTILRLYCTIFALWIGAVFILLGAVLAGVGRHRAWWPSAAVGVGLVGLLVLNAVNPEAIVVRHNVAFAQRTGRFDPAYVSGLSQDAIPTVIAALPGLDAATREVVLGRLCPPRPVREKGWAAYNVARARASTALATACATQI